MYNVVPQFDINLSHKWMQTKTNSKKDNKAKKKNKQNENKQHMPQSQ